MSKYVTNIDKLKITFMTISPYIILYFMYKYKNLYKKNKILYVIIFICNSIFLFIGTSIAIFSLIYTYGMSNPRKLTKEELENAPHPLKNTDNIVYPKKYKL